MTATMAPTDFDKAQALLSELETASLDLICTSPPFDLLEAQLDGSKIQSGELIKRFIPIVRQFARVLKPEGSLILELGADWAKRQPARRSFPYELIVHLCSRGRGLAACSGTLSVQLHPLPCSCWVGLGEKRLLAGSDKKSLVAQPISLSESEQ